MTSRGGPDYRLPQLKRKSAGEVISPALFFRLFNVQARRKPPYDFIAAY
jgi:hypothetical protein